jgi:2-keto-4-pentenoate hydratase/2-oxohepta-3-ene-1,7-dioic acid hydratase in catechol pathway
MKIATFTQAGRTRIGKVLGEEILDLSSACPQLPTTMVGLITAGADALRQAQEAGNGDRYALRDIRLEAPVPNPQKFLAIGLNYEDHAEEARKAGIKIPEHQVWFSKLNSCISGPFDPIVKPSFSDKLDYEVELGVVIGRRCKNVTAAGALSVIAGYTVCNDVTVRDWQHRTPQWTLGKSFDTHGPFGPWIVTADEIADPQNLNIRLLVNGEVRQQASTALMIHSIAAQIEHLSQAVTLEPGDVIATGTCAGVAIGMNPPRFLQPGDVVRAEIEGVGAIENRVVAA